MRTHLGVVLALGGLSLAARAANPYPWPHGSAPAIEARAATPPGFTRLPAGAGSFATWLRGLPTLPGRPEVLLFDGRRKDNQTAQAFVLDIDTGAKDLQQCADAVMRLRAEYLHAANRDAALCFRFTSGDLATWTAWRDGARPSVRGRKVMWSARAAPARDDRATFRAYLDTVFTYAGSASLARELAVPPPDARIEPGDVLIQPGFPGHAVIVLDMAEDAGGRRAYLLAQSYMPAQQVHVLRVPGDGSTAWFTADPRGEVVTPEWRFPAGSWRRFSDAKCAPPESAL